MKSASSAASGSGQQSVKRSATDAELEAHIGDATDMGIGDSTTSPMSTVSKHQMKNCREVNWSITTQEGIDGYREKHVLKRARQSNFSGRPSLRKTHGWNLKNHSRQLPGTFHTSMLVVTIRKRGERGICSASVDRAVEKCQRAN